MTIHVKQFLAAVLIVTTLLAQTSFADELKFSSGINLSYEQKVESNDQGLKPKAMGLELAPKLTWDDFTLKGKLFYGYDLDHPETGSGWSDATISSLYLMGSYAYIKISPQVSVELPLSKESRENREIEYIINAGALFALDSKALDIEKFSLSYSLTYGHFQNKYTTRVNGEPSTDYKITQALRSGYKFDPVSISAMFQFTSSYSYEDVVRSGFFHIESVSYTVNPMLGFNLYHYNKAPLLKPETYENNLKAYDPETSTVGLSMDISI